MNFIFDLNFKNFNGNKIKFIKFKLQLGRVKEIGPHSSSYTPRNATNWRVLQSGTLLRFTVTYVSLTTLKRSGIAMPTSTGLLPMKTWIDWPV